MAYCIREICPMVELYAARLDDAVRTSEFTVKSATDVSNLNSWRNFLTF
jgi:hypothetical protein